MSAIFEFPDLNPKQDSFISAVRRRVTALKQATTETDTERFCRAVLPSAGCYRVQYRPADQINPNRTRWADSPMEAARIAMELDAGPARDVYVSMASFQSPGRGDRNAARLKRSFHIDLDCGEKKPYGDKRAAAQALKRFCLETEIPVPAIVVDSGNGLHAHWAVDHDLQLSEWQIAANNLKLACELHGLNADPSVTADAARILRVPGTHNRKDPNCPLPVTLIHFKESHNSDALMASFERAAVRHTDRSTTIAINDDLAAGLLPPPPTAWFDELPDEARVTELRKMLEVLPETAADDRATWIDTLARVASAKTVPWETRVALAWEFSRRSPKSTNESLESIARTMEKLGDSTSVNALRHHARQHGYAASGPAETQYADKANAEQALTARFVHIATDDVYFDTERAVVLKKTAIKERESWRMPQRVEGIGRYDPVSILRDSPLTRRCDGFGFHPGAEAVFMEDGRLLANLFRPYSPQPCTPTLQERRLLVALLRHLFPRGSDLSWLKHLLDTYSFMVQNPGERVKFTMILVGAVEGSGKSTLMEEMPRLLFGVENVVTVSTHELESNFTDYLARAWVVVVAEVSLGTARDAARLANALKDNQTNEYLRLIEKNRAGRTQRNRVTFFGTSNDETRALHLSAFDRRSAIFATPAGVMSQSSASNLYAFLKSARAPGVLGYLARRRRIDHFNPSAAPPMTEAKKQIIKSSQHPTLGEMVDAFQAQDPPFNRDLVLADEVRECLRSRGIEVKNLSNRKLGEFLRSMPIGARQMEHQRRITRYGHSARVRPWIVRNFDSWMQSSDREVSEHLLSGRP